MTVGASWYQALASGVPVLASNMTGAAHDLLTGHCGAIVRCDEAWPAAVTDRSPIARDSTVTNAARRVANRVSARQAADWLLEFLANPGERERNFVSDRLGADSREGPSLEDASGYPRR